MEFANLFVDANGSFIRKPNSTLIAAANELASELGGRVIFSCPNYAVVLTEYNKELTIWAK